MTVQSILYIICITLLGISCSNDDISEIAREEPTNEDVPNEATNRTACINGFAGTHPCDGYDLISRLTLETLGASVNNDVWGWIAPLDSKEYALVGTKPETVFVDISNTQKPLILGRLLTATSNCIWRDIKVYNNYAFIVREAANHGMQVSDLTRLRNSDESPQNFEVGALYLGFENTHNIVINEDTGFAYAVRITTFNGDLHFINIQDPLNPAAGHAISYYTHDAQVVIYNDPNTDYQGQEIYIGSNENQIVVVDVTNKNTPAFISNTTYPDIGYTHQGWLSEDHAFFYANDELDKSKFGFESRALIFNFIDLDNPFFSSPFSRPSQAIDHNLYVNSNKLFLSNYTAGMSFVNINNLDTPVDIGFLTPSQKITIPPLTLFGGCIHTFQGATS